MNKEEKVLNLIKNSLIYTPDEGYDIFPNNSYLGYDLINIGTKYICNLIVITRINERFQMKIRFYDMSLKPMRRDTNFTIFFNNLREENKDRLIDKIEEYILLNS